VALHTDGPGQVYSGEKIGSRGEVAGLKLRVPGGVGGDVGAALGATGIQVPAPKVYETLASKAADGVVMPFESRKGFKLYEVAPYAFEMPGGLYRGSFAYIMSEETFADLPADLQQALDEKVFGEPASRMAGAVWDEIDAAGRQITLDTPGNEITPASDADIAAYEPIKASIIEAVLADIAAKGIDAAAAHAMVKTEMAKGGS